MITIEELVMTASMRMALYRGLVHLTEALFRNCPTLELSMNTTNTRSYDTLKAEEILMIREHHIEYGIAA